MMVHSKAYTFVWGPSPDTAHSDSFSTSGCLFTKDADKVQEETLQKILQENGGTKYLKQWGLNERTNAETFNACVPIVTYKDLEPEADPGILVKGFGGSDGPLAFMYIRHCLEPYIQRIADGDFTPILTAESIGTISLRKRPHIPEVYLPEKSILDIASALSIEINHALYVLREIATGRDLKKLLSTSCLATVFP
ncbi:hypothetical protein FXO37_30520 [Capsicum annuum]|nr:hypothetical protein FXO37_30520 [Capsicum annuum]